MQRSKHGALGVLLAAVLVAPAAASAATTPFGPWSMEQTYTVPHGVTSVNVAAIGAPSSGFEGYQGGGAYVSADFPVIPSETLFVEVPGPESNFDSYGGLAHDPSGTKGDGGAASDVRTVCQRNVSSGCTASEATSLASRLIVAGGGGGAGAPGPGGQAPGGSGAGGAPFKVSGGTGQAGSPGADGAGLASGGLGGTGIAGGVGGTGYPDPGSGDGDGGDGSQAFGGSGGLHSGAGSHSGGGGGGGYLGGGGGSGSDSTSRPGGGGGGSSFVSSKATGAPVITVVPANFLPGVRITPGPADTTAPTIKLSAPRNGAHYTQRQVVRASYSCADPDDSYAVACVGTVRSGAAIDTRTPGRRSFTVKATDHAANVVTRTIHYTVVAKCVVPGLMGNTLKQAKKALAKAHCRLGKVTPKGATTGKVKSQNPKPGRVLPGGAKVSIALR